MKDTSLCMCFLIRRKEQIVGEQDANNEQVVQRESVKHRGACHEANKRGRGQSATDTNQRVRIVELHNNVGCNPRRDKPKPMDDACVIPQNPHQRGKHRHHGECKTACCYMIL